MGMAGIGRIWYRDNGGSARNHVTGYIITLDSMYRKQDDGKANSS